MLNVLDLSVDDDVERLRAFSELEHPPTFRYFKHRVFEQAIRSHIITLLYSTHGYAHVDLDTQSGRHYLGICVLPEYQGNGIGKKLMNLILKLYGGDLYLTVDKDNTRAMAFYETYGFKRMCEGEISYTYKKQGVTLMETSVGEGFDKLTILDIKLEKIRDPVKKDHCRRESASIRASIGAHVLNYKHLYAWLRYVNLRIWDLQDDMRERNNYSEQGFRAILDLNDMRFRIKKRINAIFESSLQEQKGYSNKTGLFLTHLGMGDLINMNGAIRYAALMVDTLYVISKVRNSANVKDMFSDDPTIHIIECKNDDSDIQEIMRRLPGVTHTFMSGAWAGKHIDTSTDITVQFYDHLGFPREVKHAFAHFNMANSLPVPDIPYVFSHSSSSDGTHLDFTKKWKADDIFTIDPNRNVYPPDHRWFDLAEQYLNHPILRYAELIKHATEIHVTDSSFYCLACFMPNASTRKFCYDRTSGTVIRYYMFK